MACGRYESKVLYATFLTGELGCTLKMAWMDLDASMRERRVAKSAMEVKLRWNFMTTQGFIHMKLPIASEASVGTASKIHIHLVQIN